ncbi:MAG: hypothetical protein ACRCT1_15825, partial [Microcoleaceae cyanobacterium]
PSSHRAKSLGYSSAKNLQMLSLLTQFFRDSYMTFFILIQVGKNIFSLALNPIVMFTITPFP